MEQIISFVNLEVEPYRIEKLLDVHIEHRVNEHSTFFLRALLPEEEKDNCVKKGSNIKLVVNGIKAKSETLFQGMVKSIVVKEIQGSYYIEVHAVSYSYLLDTEKKSRTFQNKKMPYIELAEQVVSDYKDAMVKDVVTGGAATGQFIVQYNETDWEFLKRLASHFNTGIVNDARFGSPRCYFGIPENGKRKLQSYSYGVKHDAGRYLKLSKNGIRVLREQDFIYYRADTDMAVNIGDEISFQGEKLYVYKIEAFMEKGTLKHRLTLTTKNGMTQPYIYNDGIAGCSLNAKIVEVKNDQVKVSVKADEDLGHYPGELCFFPYSTIYSSQDGSGWYCMPEIGDSVRIYFPDGTEEHSYAISSVHEQVDSSMQQGMGSIGLEGGSAGTGNTGGSSGGGYSGQRDDPSVKSIRNKDGKEIRLTPEGIYIISDGTTITLTDDGGVSIVSDQNIEFKSDKSIILSAEEDVNIMGLTGLDLSCNETATIKMKENVEVIGQEVKSN